MVDHMWNEVDENLPDGCAYIEVLYKSGRSQTMCLCDLHWKISGKEEVPIYYRFLEVDM